MGVTVARLNVVHSMYVIYIYIFIYLNSLLAIRIILDSLC
jgi:hypothetical protein